MLELDTLADLDAYVGQSLGTSDWLQVTQDMIDRFAQATNDHQWIHTDPARAARELPGGTTIAHGFLTLALLPALAATILHVRQRSRTLNYGLNKVRFTAPVPTGARLRLHQVLKASEPVPAGRRLTYTSTLEIEATPRPAPTRPALVAETIQLAFD